MIIKLILVLLISCTFMMCSDRPKATEQSEKLVTKSQTFISPYDTLDQIELPITFGPDEWGDLYRKYLEKYGSQKGEDLMKHPYAKLVDNVKYKGIIFISTDESGSPTLMTIDRTGNPIDTLFLLGDFASNFPGKKTIELTTIDRDLTIHLLDSVLIYDLGPDGDRLEDTEKLTVSNELYRILDSGVIERIR